MRRFRLVLPTVSNERFVLPIMCTDDPFDDRCGVGDGLGGINAFPASGGGGGGGVTPEMCLEWEDQCLRFADTAPPTISFELKAACIASYWACLAIAD